MEYKIIKPPFVGDYENKTKKELRLWKDWFLASIPERIQHLEETVRSFDNFKNWKANKTPESLDSLGEWFSLNVETRKLTKEEIEDEKSRLLIPIDISEDIISDKTISLCFDIGMYLSEIFLKNRNDLKWVLKLNNKKFADYGRPILAGFGKVTCNPVRLLTVLAFSISDGSRNGQRLREIYDYWINEQ